MGGGQRTTVTSKRRAPRTISPSRKKRGGIKEVLGKVEIQTDRKRSTGTCNINKGSRMSDKGEHRNP